MKSPQTTERNHGLDMLRGLAALGIAFHHIYGWETTSYWKVGETLFSLQRYGVYTFFVLSGLTMMMVYRKIFSHEISLSNLKCFYAKRIARIMPLLMLVATAFFIFMSYRDGLSSMNIMRFLLTFTGLFSLHMPTFSSNAMGAWSLGIELLFYLIFPILALLMNNISWRSAAIFTIIIFILDAFLCYSLNNHFGKDTSTHWQYHTLFLSFFPFFLFGFLLLDFKLKPSFLYLPLGFGFLLFMFSYSKIFPLTDGYDILTFPHGFILTTVMVSTVFCFYNAQIPDFLIAPASFLGDISYAFYLTHWFFIEMMIRPGRLDLLWVIKIPLFYIACCTLAYLVYRFYERPMRSLIIRFLLPTS